MHSFPDSHPSRRISFLGALLLVCAGLAYRIAIPVFGLAWNSAPLMAIAFGGGLLLGMRSWWIPALALIASDLILGLIISGGGVGTYTLMSALIYTGAAWCGAWVGKSSRTWLVMWSGTLVSGIIFYIVANTFSWLTMPEYAKTLAGWWQSQTTGLPQYTPPAWAFLRNALLGDTFWCVIAGLLFLPHRLGAKEHQQSSAH